jgi:hypothetical protein
MIPGIAAIRGVNLLIFSLLFVVYLISSIVQYTTVAIIGTFINDSIFILFSS